MPGPTIVILAAGQGTRMRSSLPKVLHPLLGRPLVLWPVHAALDAGAGSVVVVGGPDRRLEEQLPDGVALAVQPQPDGTGGAVKAVADLLPADAPVLVLAGDVPLVTAEAIRGLVEAHERSGAQATMATMLLDDPAGYGRVVRAPDGSVERVVETKAPGDATADELAIREVNTGVFAFEREALVAALARLRPDNAQGELYLPDVLPLVDRVAAHVVDDPTLTLGVNDRADLARVATLARARVNAAHGRAGVTIEDPASTWIDVDVAIEPDATILPGTTLRGATHVGAGATVGPHVTATDSRIGADATVLHAVLVEAQVGAGATVGPFAYLRPHARLGEGAKVGTFVELKNTTLGAGAKVPHLSYLGDADVGAKANLGAGTITANYDGQRKHRTTIGAGVKGGVDTAFVAPVTVGENAWTAAGSVVTEDVPPGALAVARGRQTNVTGYDERRRRQAE